MKSAGRVAAITGGAAGIGLALARKWIAEGGKAVLLDRNAEALAVATSALAGVDGLANGVVRGLCCDVSDVQLVDSAVASIADGEGQLDALVNGAGVILPMPSAQVADEDFGKVLDIHVTGAMRMCRAAYPLLRKAGGSVVNISSVAACVGMPLRASYTAAKSGVEGLTRTLAVEWAPDGIRVNAVAPGYTQTEMTGYLIRQGKLNVSKIEARTPLRRFADAAEIASAIFFLLSNDASYITGHSLVVDGGMTIDGNWY